MNTGGKWRAIRGPCPICGRPGGWCSASEDGKAIICRRQESRRPVPQRDGQPAWLHDAPGAGAAPLKLDPAKPENKLTRAELEIIGKRCRTALSPNRMEALARSMGATAATMGRWVEALTAYGAGFDDESGWYSFPMYDGKRQLVGFNLRSPQPGGGKKAIVGSRNGLFVPADYGPVEVPFPDAYALVVLTPEGVSDCVAARAMGFRAIGRPSNAGGGEMLCDLLGRGVGQDVVVVADRDEAKYRRAADAPGWEEPHWPGIEGALSLVEQLYRARVAARLRYLLMPGPEKDVRAWLLAQQAECLNPGLRFWFRMFEATTERKAAEAKDVAGDVWIAAARRKLAKNRMDGRREMAKEVA